MRETRVRSLGWEDPLEKEMATHSSTLAWRLPWREEPGRLQSMGSQRVGHNWVTLLLLYQSPPTKFAFTIHLQYNVLSIQHLTQGHIKYKITYPRGICTSYVTSNLGISCLPVYTNKQKAILLDRKSFVAVSESQQGDSFLIRGKKSSRLSHHLIIRVFHTIM